jgi:hypothetical protein
MNRAGSSMDNQFVKTLVTVPLRCAIAVLPFSLFLNFWPNHTRAALGVGLGIGVICAQLIPPRQSIRRMLLQAAIAAIIGALLPTLWGFK